MNYKALLQYDGGRYYGWQDNNCGPTIEASVAAALSTVFPQVHTIQAASRTDRGVHAEGQVLTYTAPPASRPLCSIMLSLNRLLPQDIRLRELCIVEEGFHPSLDAQSKRYSYTIDNDRIHSPFALHHAWHVPQALDTEAMARAGKRVLGSRDCSALSNQHYDNPICHLYDITLDSKARFITITMHADRFLFRMARIIAGTLVAIGRGQIAEDALPSILAERRRAAAGVTAPPHGLVLKEVIY